MTPDPFRSTVRAEGVRLYRDLPWRRTRDPYAIWLSEVMLQQTQVARVLTRWPEWLERFPDVSALAAAGPAEVLDAWQGMGYNRRALALHRAAQAVMESRGGEFPQSTAELKALPGIGPATAQGIRAFAFDLPGVYLETNVRTVFLHHCFPEVEGVPDRDLVPLVEAACPAGPGAYDGYGADTPQQPYAMPQDADDTPRSWYYALLDYGAYLKKTLPNPSRRSKGYTRQSKFEGSRRQKRAELVRMLLGAAGAGLTKDELVQGLCDFEQAAARPTVDDELVLSIMDELEHEGFCTRSGDVWRIA